MEDRFRMGKALMGMPALEIERAVCESEIDEAKEAEEACRAFGIDIVRGEDPSPTAVDSPDGKDTARAAAYGHADALDGRDGCDLDVTEIPENDPNEERKGDDGDAPKRKKPSKRRGKRKGEENVELGRRGEDAAARFLYRRGYDIVERNWKCAAGEADIIARDGDVVVFVEVKTRTSIEKGLPSDAVDKRKREKYEKIAALFLMDYDAVDVPVRFDVVSLLVIGTDRALVRHHINAFAAG